MTRKPPPSEAILIPGRQGSPVHQRVSYPSRCGRYHELRLNGLVAHLALDRFPKFVQLTGPHWPHPQEWLKITRAGDTLYYALRGYSGLHDLTGEYYYPLPSFPGNPIYRPDQAQARAWQQVLTTLARAQERAARSPLPGHKGHLLRAFAAWTEKQRLAFAHRLHRILRARIPVLPPDCRHVDYDVLPVILADGCLANCGFCRIKSGSDFQLRPAEDIRQQLTGLMNLFAEERANIRGIFLGQNDALAAGATAVARTIRMILRHLDRPPRYVRDTMVFLFASCSSFLALTKAELDRLQELPCRLFINLGLESFDQASLEALRKPVRAADNRTALERMLAINRTAGQVTISANILLGDSLPPSHLESLSRILARPGISHPDTVLYLSPLMNDFHPTSLISLLRRLKKLSRLSLLPYLIQRL